MRKLNPLGKRKNVEICDHGAGRRVGWKRDLDLLQVRVFGPILFESRVDASQLIPFFLATFRCDRVRQSAGSRIGL